MKNYNLLLLSLCLVICSCEREKEPSLIINQTEITVSDAGGSQSISFESNMNWTARSSESWCTVSPSSGDALIKSTTISLSANDTYDNRSCSVTITVGSLFKTILVNQKACSGILLGKYKYDLTNEATSIEVEVKANVNYEIEISDKWITQTEAKGLTSTKLTFNIAKNNTYSNREGTITFKQKNGSLSSAIKVYQSQEDAIIISDNSTELSSDSQVLEVELKTNVDFEVVIPESAKSWIAYAGTKALRTETLLLDIAKNEDYNARTTEIYVKNKATSLQDTLTIKQAQLDAIIISEKSVTLQSNNQTIDVEVKTNVDFEILISEYARHWVSYNPTKALRTETILIDIAENLNNEARSTKIFIKDKETKLRDTLNITQLAYEPGVYWVFEMGTLGTILNQNQRDTITTMIVKGEINKADFEVMKKQMPKLKHIDLKDVKCKDNKIPNEAFGGWSYSNSPANKNISTIILPESITAIGQNAFVFCESLSGSLTMPNGLVRIEESAFEHCSGLTALKLGNKLSEIKKYAFKNCSNISGKILFPIKVSSISEEAFYYCNQVEAFQFPHTSPISHSTNMLPTGASVEVPISAVNIYKATNGWKNYNIIGNLHLIGSNSLLISFESNYDPVQPKKVEFYKWGGAGSDIVGENMVFIQGKYFFEIPLKTNTDYTCNIKIYKQPVCLIDTEYVASKRGIRAKEIKVNNQGEVIPSNMSPIKVDESIPPEVFFLVEDIHPESEILYGKYANAWFSVIHDTRKGGVSKVEIESLKLYARLNNGKDTLLMFSNPSNIKWDGKLYIRYPYFEYSLDKQFQWEMPTRLENRRLTFNPSDITNRVWHGWCIGPWPKIPVNTKRLWIKVKAKITGNALMQIGVDLKTDQNTNDNWDEYGVSNWFFATNNFQEIFFNKP